MKIRAVACNIWKKAFEGTCSKGSRLQFPYSKNDPKPEASDAVVGVFADQELGRKAFTYGSLNLS